MNVRILRSNPNAVSGSSSQYVTTAKVSKEVAFIFEDFKKGRCTLEEAEARVDEAALAEPDDIVKVPFSVYINVHSSHASIFFVQTDMLNRKVDTETQTLSKLIRGLRVFFCENTVQIINPGPIRRVDLFTEDDGSKYKIEMNGDVLKPGYYTLFKCYEVIGISDIDIEWCYLMAAQDWYDTAVNNCLTFSKRIIRELHKRIMDGDDLTSEELKKLNKLYISVPGEASFERLRSRISCFLKPGFSVVIIVLLLAVFVVAYIELRLSYF